jgi:hypothetical protein
MQNREKSQEALPEQKFTSTLHHCEITDKQLTEIKAAFDYYASNGSDDIIVNLGNYEDDSEEFLMLVGMFGDIAHEYHGDMVIFHY